MNMDISSVSNAPDLIQIIKRIFKKKLSPLESAALKEKAKMYESKKTLDENEKKRI
jgi:hypothetical protein